MVQGLTLTNFECLSLNLIEKCFQRTPAVTGTTPGVEATGNKHARADYNCNRHAVVLQPTKWGRQQA